MQIYCDFSGYTDIAVGISSLLGIQLNKNFDLPYCASNPSEFWKRWHISLSSWFRDYVYIPLGGSQKGNSKTYLNITITMILSGIWHGAGWTYIIWGLMHAIAQCAHRCYNRLRQCRKKMNDGNFIRDFKKCLAIGINFIFICFTWTIFRAETLRDALTIIKRIISWQNGVTNIYIYLDNSIFFPDCWRTYICVFEKQ